jgi:hypothetical protein
MYTVNVDLPNDKPQGDIRKAPDDIFMPTKHDYEALQKDFISLISLVLVKYVPALEEYESLVPQHISHAKTSEMSKKSEIVSMHAILQS